jgi:hypothetical protein
VNVFAASFELRPRVNDTDVSSSSISMAAVEPVRVRKMTVM